MLPLPLAQQRRALPPAAALPRRAVPRCSCCCWGRTHQRRPLPCCAGMGAAAVFERGGEVDDAPRRPVSSQLTGLSRDAQVS